MPKTMIAQRSTWTKVAFGDVVQLSRERSSDPERDGHERFIGLEHIDPGDLRLRRWGNVADGVTFTSVFRPGQVLFGKRRAYQRKIAVADFSGVCSGDIYVLEPKGKALLPELLPFICQTEAFFEHAVGTSAGSLSPRTNWESLASFEFTLPPIEEQRRLVVALTVARRCREALQALSVSANDVVSAIREHTFGVHTASVPLKTLCSGGQGIQIGPFGAQLHRSDYRESGVPVVMPTELVEDRIDDTTIARVSESKAESLAAHRLVPYDIVLPRRGDFNRRAVVSGREKGWLCGTGCLRIRLDTPSLAPLVAQSLSSQSVLAWLNSRSVGTVMPNLNLQIVGSIPITLPFPAEAHRAQSAIEQLRTRRQAADRRAADLLTVMVKLMGTCE